MKNKIVNSKSNKTKRKLSCPWKKKKFKIDSIKIKKEFCFKNNKKKNYKFAISVNRVTIMKFYIIMHLLLKQISTIG